MSSVQISPSAEEQIEFHKIREILSSYAKGAAGRAMCLTLHPLTEIDLIRGRVDEVYEFTSIAALPDRLQLGAYEDVSTALDHLGIEGYVLSEEDIHEIGKQMEQVQRLFSFFKTRIGKENSLPSWPGFQEFPIHPNSSNKSEAYSMRKEMCVLMLLLNC
jgi:dsDNA-specific endonuclease/ATPase MutS2